MRATMDLDATIHSPQRITNGRAAWTGTLAEAIRQFGPAMEERAVAGGLPECEDGPDWGAFTLADWRVVLDDPNAMLVEDYLGYRLPLGPAQFRALREACKISREELAARVRVGHRAVRRWDMTHTAPMEVAKVVVAAWVDVRDEALQVARECPDVFEVGPTQRDRAVAQAAMVMLAAEGYTPSLVTSETTGNGRRRPRQGDMRHPR